MTDFPIWNSLCLFAFKCKMLYMIICSFRFPNVSSFCYPYHFYDDRLVNLFVSIHCWPLTFFSFFNLIEYNVIIIFFIITLTFLGCIYIDINPKHGSNWPPFSPHVGTKIWQSGKRWKFHGTNKNFWSWFTVWLKFELQSFVTSWVLFLSCWISSNAHLRSLMEVFYLFPQHESVAFKTV